MTSIFTTMRQMIASAESALSEVRESRRQIDDVIDGVPNAAKVECGNMQLDLYHVSEELGRLDEILEQLEAGATKVTRV